MAKAKIKWVTYTDNPQWGRFFIGEGDSRREAIDKGKFVVEKRFKWKYS